MKYSIPEINIDLKSIKKNYTFINKFCGKTEVASSVKASSYGLGGQKKIIQSKVLIIGMGGLGCPAAEYLTRAGVGKLGIIDPDKVELSNIHRQSLYDINDIKKFKVIVTIF